MIPFGFSGMLPDAVLPPHRDHAYAQWKHRVQQVPSTLQPSPLKSLKAPAIKKISDTNSEGKAGKPALKVLLTHFVLRVS